MNCLEVSKLTIRLIIRRIYSLPSFGNQFYRRDGGIPLFRGRQPTLLVCRWHECVEHDYERTKPVRFQLLRPGKLSAVLRQSAFHYTSDHSKLLQQQDTRPVPRLWQWLSSLRSVQWLRCAVSSWWEKQHAWEGKLYTCCHEIASLTVSTNNNCIYTYIKKRTLAILHVLHTASKSGAIYITCA